MTPAATAPVLGYLPSPSNGVWHLGPLPVRAYALAILAGIVVAIWVGTRRWVARGGAAETVTDVAVWAVPFGIVGGRLYHVVSSPAAYFGPDGDPWRALEIWRGGLGVWGAIALGAVGAWIGCRRAGVRLPAFADAVAPGILLAQAVGRLGNWFNQELFGAPTTVPWALMIDPQHRPAGYEEYATFHPTFLYELLWNVAGVVVLLWLDRRLRLGHGRVFWAYVCVYTLGRGWIEALRIDDAERVLGLRLNVWTSVLLFVVGLVGYLLSARLRPGRETDVYRPGHRPDHADGTHGGADVLSATSADEPPREQTGGQEDEQEPGVPAGQTESDEQPPRHP